MKRKRSVISIVTAVMMIVTMLTPIGVSAETQDTQQNISVNSQEELIKAINDGNSDIQIESSITLTEKVTIPADYDIHLKGVSGTEELKADTGTAWSWNKKTEGLIIVSGTLTVENLTINAEYKLRTIFVADGAKLVLEDGACIKNGQLGDTAEANGEFGGGIKVGTIYGKSSSHATLIMNEGARVTGCKASGTYPIEGIGIGAGKYAEVTVYGGEISENIDARTGSNVRYFSNGGGIALASSYGKLNINGGSISDNTARGYGGGIYISSANSSMNIYGGSISGNTCDLSGGGIYNCGTANMNQGKISGNTAETSIYNSKYACGGGIYNIGTFNMNDGSVENNTADTQSTNSAAPYVSGQGGGIFTEGVFTLYGGTIKLNTAGRNGDLDFAAGCGGGISVAGGSEGGTLCVKGGEITQNTAEGCGGGIYINKQDAKTELQTGTEATIVPGAGTFALQDMVTIYGNLNTNGSADNIYLPENTRLTIAGELDSASKVLVGSELSDLGTIIAEAGEGYELLPTDARVLSSNTGIKCYELNDSGEIVIGEERSNYISIEGADVSGVKDKVYTGEPVTQEIQVTKDGILLKKGRDYSLSYKDNVDAGTATLRIIGQGDYIDSITVTFTIAARDMKDTVIDPIRERLVSSDGAAVEPELTIRNGNSILEKDADYTVLYQNNTEVGTAQAIVTAKGNNYTGSTEADFEIISRDGKNIASTAKELSELIQVGGTEEEPAIIYISGAVGEDTVLEIPEGKCFEFIGDGNAAEITALQIMEELIDVKGTLTLENVKLNAASNGRCVKVEAGGSLTLKADSAVINGKNSTTDNLNGTGIYIEENGIVCIEGGKIAANKKEGASKGLGGGIYNKGELTLAEGEITGNSNTRGGGIYNEGTLLITGGTVSDNTAVGSELNSVSGEGGGLFNIGETTVVGGEIKSNTASENGGGISNYSKLMLQAGTVEQNKASKLGGGICTFDELIMTGGKIADNTATDDDIDRVRSSGGGVYVAAGSFTMNDGEISGNTAKSTFVDNQYYGSVGNGGGVYVSNNADKHCIFTMNGGSISNNVASSYLKKTEAGHGGGVYVMGGQSSGAAYPGTFVMTGGEITANRASETGDGVFMNNCEKADNQNRFSQTFSADYEGAAFLSLSENADISYNYQDDMYLKDGVVASVSKNFSDDKLIGITAEAGRDVVLAEGTDECTLIQQDADTFVNKNGKRQIFLDNDSNTIMLKAEDISSSYRIVLSEELFTYSGTEQKPEVTVVSTLDSSISLNEGTDYKVKYPSNCITKGTKTVKVTGEGDFTGTITAEYTIEPKSIEGITAEFATQTYTGKALTPVPVSNSVKDGTKVLLRGEDYKIVSYSNNINAGMASVTLEGIGNYTGQKTVSFKIVKGASKLTASLVSNKVYTGKAIKPSVVVKDGTVVLKNGTDYTLSYKNNIKTGAATIVITGKGYYTGTKNVTFKIIPKKAGISSLSAQKKALKVKWKKDSQASGYQIQIALNKKFTSGKKTYTITKYSTVSKTIKSLKSKKTYYVRVRAYKTIGGKKYYGDYSTIKYKKTK